MIFLSRGISEREGLIIVLAASFLFLPVILLQPLAPDQATYQSMALDLVKRNQLPYVGSWDLNFPGIVYIHAVGITLFGSSDIAFRLLDLLSCLATTLILYKLGLRWFAAREAVLTAILFVIQYTGKTNWTIGQRDAFAMTFVLTSAYTLLKATDRIQKQNRILLTISIAGLMMGSAIMIRPTYILFAASSVIILFKAGERSVRLFALYTFTCALPLLIFIVSYSLHPGALYEAYLATVRFNADIYGGRLMNGFAIFRLLLHFSLIVSIVYFLWQAKRSHLQRVPGARVSSLDLQLIGLFMLSVIAGVMSMGKYFVYQYEVIWPFVCAIGAYIVNRIVRRFGMMPLIPLALILLGWFYLYFPWRIERTFLLTGMNSNWAHAYDLAAYGQADFLEDEIVLRNRIQHDTNPSDTVEACAMNAGARWRIDRPMANRFTSVYPLVLSNQGHYTDYQKEWRKSFVETLRSKRPRYIVLDKPPLPGEPRWMAAFTPGYRDLISNLPPLKQLLDERYSIDTVLATFVLYKFRE
jgi:hypothetical protein